MKTYPNSLRVLLAIGVLVCQQALFSEDYYDIGGLHQKVSTASESAQTWFDRGLAMCYGFNHEEAVRCFEKAIQADPEMVMAYWGMAYALGPNINYLDVPPHQITQADLSLRLAKLHLDNATDLEKRLIEALGTRHAVPLPEDRNALNQAYAEAMRSVYEKYSGNPLVATLYAESLMNLQPWKHWSPEGVPAKHTPEIMAVLEKALASNPDYPALCHLYIHTVEASQNPGKALPAANALRNAMPGSGHLLHMPTHIDVLVGDYKQVIESNQKGIEMDNEFLKNEGPYNFYSLYRIHNYHFLVYGAMFDGQSELAMEAARAIPKQVPEDMLIGFVDFLDAFMPTHLHVMVRFGKWEEILEEPQPAEYLPMARSIWHYARTLAFASLDRIEEAEKEYAAFSAAKELVPDSSILFNNMCRDILGVADKMAAGEVYYRKGQHELAFRLLREAVKRDDALNYDEPWGWMQPARHALGALLLEQGQVAEAESVYRTDLKRHPKNVWALHGLAEALERQGALAEARGIQAIFKEAVVRSDVEVDRSCYCRINN
ncbi:MAG: tetratricopeptide repeat protein [Puniceicoccaceae bacterium]